jgi:nucleoside-diphosphate-sugar epimerase
MNALITGGAGFIGSNLASRLLADGHRITVLDNFSSGYRWNLAALPGARVVEGDIRDGAAVAKAMESVETVFHLAAAVGNKRSIDAPILDAEVNVIGTLRLLEAARAAGVRKFVTSSSAGIFGELKTLPIREDHAIEPDTPYGASKLCAEKETLAFGKLYGIETVCLRYFNVYGPRQRFDAYGNVIPIFVFQLLAGERLTIYGDGCQTRDFVNVRDVVQANLRAASTPGVRGAFNIGSGSGIAINSLVRKLADIARLEPRVQHAPARPGDVRDSLADISAAREAFGFEPAVDLDEGLAEYVAWAREERRSHAA